MDSQTVERRAQHQPRLEDDPLVRGLGRYAADAPMSGETQAYFVRSPHAFADIRSIDTAAAKAAHQRIILQARLVLRAAFNGLRIHVGFQIRQGLYVRGARL